MYLTLPEAARQLKVSVRTLRRLHAAGRLDFIDLGSGGERHNYRVTQEALANIRPAKAPERLPPTPPRRGRAAKSAGRVRVW